MKKTIEDYLNFVTVAAIILIALLLPACATTDPNVKTHPGKQLALKQPVREMREISHFVTFKAPPDGVEVIAVDTVSGKEVASLGTTPVRVLVLRKKLSFVDGKVADVLDIRPTANALSYGSGIMGGVEFQFKFRKYGFSDQMILEKIPFLMGDSDKVIEITMKRE